MKYLFALGVTVAMLMLVSCGNGSNTPPPAVVVPDTVTAGSYSWLAYNADSMILHDLTVNNYPVIVLQASDVYNPTDSIWTLSIQVTDKTNTRYSMMLNAQNTSPTGLFTVVSNSSSFTDFGGGLSKRTYSIDIGSVINVVTSTPLKGNMSLGLHYNFTSTTAVDTFQFNN